MGTNKTLLLLDSHWESNPPTGCYGELLRRVLGVCSIGSGAWLGKDLCSTIRGVLLAVSHVFDLLRSFARIREGWATLQNMPFRREKWGELLRETWRDGANP